MIVSLIAAAIALAMVGNFFWPILKDFNRISANGGHGSKIPLLMFGGFFLVVIITVLTGVVRAFRSPANSAATPANSPSGGMAGRAFMILFSLPFAGFGVFALVQAIRKLVEGDLKNAGFIALFGLIFSSVGFGLMAATIWGGKKQKAEAANQSRNPEKPWLWRDDWAAGKIKPSGVEGQNFFWIWSILALAMSAPALIHLPQEWQKGNHAILVVLLFPAVAFYLMGYSLVQWRSRRRFGDCFFELAQIPAPLGGTLDGLIQTSARIRLEHGLHLKLSCVRRTVTGAGKNRSVQESILWQDEKVFKTEADLPEPEPGRSGIPIFFKLPADQPESSGGGDDAVLWRLEARAKMSGPDFRAQFEVPVFHVAGAAVAAEAVESDSTVALQESVEEIRRDENSKIQVADGPRGREFYFPAARNLGMVIAMTVFWLIWSGVLWFMIVQKAPVLFPIVFGLVDVLVFFGLLNAWLKSSRITINSSSVTAVNRWLIFSRTRQFDAGDIAEIIAQQDMQSGSQIYWAIRLVTRASSENLAAARANFQPTGQLPSLKMQIREARKGTALANGIKSKLEADWLVREMNRALGHRA